MHAETKLQTTTAFIAAFHHIIHFPDAKYGESQCMRITPQNL